MVMYWNDSGLSNHFTIRAVLQCSGREILLRAVNYLKQLSWFLSSWLMKVRKEKNVWILESHFRTRGIWMACRSCNAVYCCQSEVLASSLTPCYLSGVSLYCKWRPFCHHYIWILKRLVCLYVFYVPLCPLIQLTIFEFVGDFRTESQEISQKIRTFSCRRLSSLDLLLYPLQSHHLQPPPQTNEWSDQ